MPGHSLDLTIRWLRGLAAGRPGRTDAELLRAYTEERDDAAFSELLRRHGGLVWSVCRRLLPREQDAEDAFQATFLVLAQKAGSVRAGASLPSWLFSVARRTAILVRSRAGQPSPHHEPLLAPDPAAEAEAAEVCDAILEEAHRLPEKYRLPLLLCGLEGLGKAEAARRLGWKEGTVSGRLARARRLLRARLERRGLVDAVACPALTAAVPGRLLAATARAAQAFSGPNPPVPTPLPITVAREVMRSMNLTMWKLLPALAGLVTLAVGSALLYHRPAGPPVPPTAAAAAKDESQPLDPVLPRWQERLRLGSGAGGPARAFSPDGRLLATVDGRNVLHFLDTATWREQARCERTEHPAGAYVPSPGFSPDGKLYGLWWQLPAEGRRAAPRQETWLIDTASGKVRHVVPGGDPRFSPDGKTLAVRRGDGLILWDYAAGAEVRTLPGAPAKWQANWFSPDGKFLYVPTAGGDGKLWEVATGKEVAALEGFDAVWAGDGKSLATVVPGPSVKLWDAATGRPRATLAGFDAPGCVAAFSPDGRLLLTSTRDYGPKPPKSAIPQMTAAPKRHPLDVRLWDARTGRELRRLPGDLLACRTAQFSPDGKAVAYLRLTDDPGFVMEGVVWDLAAAKGRTVVRAEGSLEELSFTPDGATLVGLANPRKPRGKLVTWALHLWDAATGRPLPPVPGTEELTSIPQVLFSPDGKTLTLNLPAQPGEKQQELRVYQLRAAPVTGERRGGPGDPGARQEGQLKPPPPPDAAQALKALTDEFREAILGEGGLADRLAAAKGEDARRRLRRELTAATERYTSRALDLAREHPGGPAAAEALEFALRNTGGKGGRLGELGGKAVAQVRKDFLTSPALDRLLYWLISHSEEAQALLEAAFEQSPHRTVRGRAGYYLARALAERADAAQLLRQMPDLAKDPAFAEEKPAVLALLRAADPTAAARRAEEVYERLRKDYADVPQSGSRPGTLGEAAEQGLFALRRLALGGTAPDIDGSDLDGKKFKLSDYRGKVVVLVFGGHWCGPCRAMNPHKQALLRRYAGKPFALVEVNSDGDPAEWKRVMKKEGYTWRCWADGQGGPIAKQWNVVRWPAVYVLDPRGVIRYKEVRDEPLQKAVDTLLAEAAK
jgi:RNA polymerase sigma factor (sigma-70 family)